MKIQKIKSSFVKNALTLTVGSGIAQIFPLFAYPILGRLYSPQDFGLLAILASITSILTVLSTGRYENCILITRSKNDAADIVGLSLVLSFSNLIISLVFLNLFSNQLVHSLNEPRLKHWVYICPISAFSIVIYNCYNEWCVKNKYYINLSGNKIINSASIILSKLMLGFYRVFTNGLIIGDFIGRLISAFLCVFRGLITDHEVFKKMSWSRMKYLAYRYKEFPTFNLPAQLLNIAGFSLPVFLIGAYFKSADVGYFSVTMDAFVLPESVISASLRDVFRQRASEEFILTGNCLKMYKKLLSPLLFFGIIGSCFLFFILPEVFSIVMGKQWRISGEYSQILLPMMVLDFIAVSLSGVLIIAEKLKVILLWQVYYVGITFLSLVLGFVLFHDIKRSLVCFAIGRSSAYIFNILLSYKYSKGKN